MEVEIVGCNDTLEHFAQIYDCLGNAYCASQDNLLDSFAVAGACARMQPFVPENPGDICCDLIENKCEDNGDGFLCVPRVKDCSLYTEEGEDVCEVNQCYWDEMNGVCVSFSRGCYDYTDSTDCTDDVQNVAKEDPNCKYGEYQLGGNPYVVSRDTCNCVWVDTGVGACSLRYNVTMGYGDGSDHSLCSYLLNVTEYCEEGDIGFEKYIYEATYNENSMPVSGLNPSDVACADRAGQRRCGVPVVKVPFFDFTNLILVVLCIFMIYCFRSKFNLWLRQ